MLAALVQTSRQTQHFIRRVACGRNGGVECRFALCQRTGLVHDQGIDFTHSLDRASIAEQNTLCGSASGGHHHRHRRGQPQRTGAGDDQYCDGVDQTEHPARLGTEQTPDEEGGDRDEHHHENELASHHVSHALHRCLRALGIGHHLHDLRQHGRCTDFFRAHHQSTAGVERGADQFVAQALGYRNGLAGEHGFIHRAAAFGNDAIDRDFLARAHAQQIADMHLVQLHIFLTSIRVDAPRSLGRQPE